MSYTKELSEDNPITAVFLKADEDGIVSNEKQAEAICPEKDFAESVCGSVCRESTKSNYLTGLYAFQAGMWYERLREKK